MNPGERLHDRVVEVGEEEKEIVLFLFPLHRLDQFRRVWPLTEEPLPLLFCGEGGFLKEIVHVVVEKVDVTRRPDREADDPDLADAALPGGVVVRPGQVVQGAGRVHGERVTVGKFLQKS